MVRRNALGALATLLLVALRAAAAPVTFDLAGSDGERHSSQQLRESQATVLIFLATDCPISNRYAPTLQRLQEKFAAQGVLFFAVFSDATQAATDIAKHLKEYQLSMPGLMDPAASLARQTGAKVTPEAVVLDADGRVAYRGRINDRYIDFGKERTVVQREDLSDAIASVLAHRPIAQPVTKALGCAIPGVHS